MPLLSRLIGLWSNLFRKNRAERELAEEIRAHLEMLIELKIEEGLDPAEARRAALIELGGEEQVKESVREVRMGYHLETLGHDLRFALRMLRRNPGFTLIAVLMLSLGIGANTAIFSLVDAVLLKLLPVKEPEQLVLLSYVGSRGPGDEFSYGHYERFRDHNQSFSGTLAYHPLRLTVSLDGQPEPAVSGQLITGNYYAVLGVNASLGRTILPDDDRVPGGHPVCVISNNYWQRRFAGASSVVGKTIHLGGSPFTIIGVTPPEFFGLEVGAVADISVPMMMRNHVIPGIDGNRFQYRVMGRMKPGVTIEQAQADLSRLYQQILDDFASQFGAQIKMKGGQYLLERRLVLAAGSQGLSVLRRQFSQPLFTLMTVVGLVLLIACANVAGLLLAKATARRKEIGIRLALGAGRGRLVKQLLTESLLLAGLGGCLGLLFAYWGIKLLVPLLPQGETPIYLNLSPDARLLGFSMALTLLTGVLFGLAPAFRATKVDLNAMLKDGAQRSSSRGAQLPMGKLFVIAQVALSLLLLVSASLFIRSLQNLRQLDAGFARENVLVLKLEPVGSDRNEGDRLAIRYNELLERVEAIPGVLRASLVGYSPITRREWLEMGQSPALMSPVIVKGPSAQPGEEITIPWMQVYPNSFATLGMPLLAGRDFTPQDTRQSQPVAIINESMARRLFGSENPLGRRFCWSGDCMEMEIVGVVKDARYLNLREQAGPMYYVPFYQTGWQGQMTLVVRTASDPTIVAAVVQREARALDNAMPLFAVETLATQIEASLSQERLVAAISSVFGLLALLLACIGLYGLLSYTVTRRTNEIGIRLALGAQSQDVLWLVFRDALWMVLIGIAIGGPAAVAATRLISSQLFGVTGADLFTIFSACMILSAVAALASFLPARRATRVDPVIALRYE
jgi:predicted permease